MGQRIKELGQEMGREQNFWKFKLKMEFWTVFNETIHMKWNSGTNGTGKYFRN